MHQIKDNIYFIKIFLKVSVSIICYLAFTLYTVPMYKNVRAYVDEKMLSDKKAIVVGETSVIVDIVDTPEERERGLSGRIELLENEGMLFIFEELDTHGFWMKDMNFSIDIIWFNQYAEAVHIMENVAPDTYPAVFSSPEKAKYVLEVPAGFIKSHGIKLGDTIDLY